ncbi:MAG: Xaa-Pro peptidase family protein [Alphaproteobacteria bacterium]
MPELIEMNGHGRLGFSLDEYRRRYEVVLAEMAALGVDVLLVRGPENITYLTGYETPGYYKYHCLIVVPGEEPVFVLRRFEELNIPEYSWLTRHVPVDDWEHPPGVTARTLAGMGLGDKRIGVEKKGWFFTVEEYETLRSAFPNASFVDATSIVEEARVVKSDEEVAIMRRSAKILDKAVQAGIDAVAPGSNDDDVNAVVNKVLLENGGEYMGLPPFILSGPRTCLPHQTARSEIIGARDLVYFEVSCSQYRYAAAVMRTIFVGEPETRQRACAEAVLEGLQAAMDTMRAGISSEAVDAAARGIIDKAGFGEYFRHRLGYSIGLNYPPDWGEGQILSLRQGEPRLLEENMTFHMVPLCLVYREFGVGFSATVRVTSTGCEEFSALPRTIIVK